MRERLEGQGGSSGRRTLGALAVLVATALLGVPGTSLGGPSEADRRAYARPDTIPFPADNPYTPEKASLGKMLFFDTRLSRDGNLSCSSCHNPSFGWEMPFAKAIGDGGRPVARHSPTVINLAWSEHLLWNGAATSLEAQARRPIESPATMSLPMTSVRDRLQAVGGYRRAFADAFPREGLSVRTILQAIATFERTIVTGTTPFDRWLAGDDGALEASAEAGFALFGGKAGCSACHSGWNFTDGRFHDIGLASEDPGRAAVTGKAEDRHAFKTPSLREIASRAPYMHDGSLPTLEAVIAHYRRGGTARASRSAKMRALSLSARETRDLIAFLHSLSSPQQSHSMPQLPADLRSEDDS